ALDDSGNAAVVGGDHVTQVLRVELRRQRRRAYEIAKQYRQLSAFDLCDWLGTRPSLRPFSSGRRRGTFAQHHDGLEELAAIAYRSDADLSKIVRDQPGQYLGVDAVVAKRRLILL